MSPDSETDDYSNRTTSGRLFGIIGFSNRKFLGRLISTSFSGSFLKKEEPGNKVELIYELILYVIYFIYISTLYMSFFR
jgi:hypothetical protein